MTTGATIAEPPPSSRAFDFASRPARLIGRYRSDLAASLVADERRLARHGTAVAVLIGVAVAYPVVASIVRAVVGPSQGGDTLLLALRPFFDVVYTESLPFMLVAVGLGLLSPALGVLLMTVFIPADLLAASSSATQMLPLQNLLPFAPVLARMISYGLLWILAVEIPIWARAWIAASTTRRHGEPSMVTVIGGYAAAAAIFVLLWAAAEPWLIRPVFSWTWITEVPGSAESPLLDYWPVLVVGAAVVAGLAALWLWSPGAWPMANVQVARPTARRSTARQVAWQLALGVVVVLLLAGMVTTELEGVVLVSIVLVGGPVLSVIVPRIPVPRLLGRSRRSIRFALALLLGFAATLPVLWLLVETIPDPNFFYGYMPQLLALAAAVLVFRVIFDAGTQPMDVR